MAKILVANWKMNPAKEADAVKLAKASDNENVILCPPFPFIKAVKQAVKRAHVGAQDISTETEGPFTGEVSGEQLKAMGAEYVIVGHSSRREHLGETDEIVAKKVAAAFSSQLIPIVCIGETGEDKARGRTKEVLDRQLRTAFSLIPAGGNEKFNAILTYEPVWAISTNQPAAYNGKHESATPELSQDMINYMEGIIRGLPLTPAFLYGGSVDSANLDSFFKCPEVQGALVGAASLKPVEFKKMITIASKH